VEYHDREWGVANFDERHLFEMLILEGAQAGLAWITILRKRESYRAAFDGFDPERIARYDARQTARLLGDPGIVRNRAKVAAAVGNAKAYLALRDVGGSLAALALDAVGGTPRRNAVRSMAEVPARTAEADALAKRLARLGFKFVGSTIVYAWMQAVGVVDDHLVSCFRKRELDRARRAARRGR
jgi:DNA-3-methyladenine glycosylase I